MSAIENLALACVSCNLHKSPTVGGIDPLTDALVPLYHPRRDRWADHFGWIGIEVQGGSAIGRSTVRTLAMNGSPLIKVRHALAAEGVWRPRNRP